ncbi:hypothetical protein [Naasia sp. SYSU D00948]|uniref:hypothetical protein n=1 Tax=Naasia sp. SYSU D00948 TaxID=2817379 RepID=UPI001B317F9A|nr:hypothetical protein [Naasia sp. SYSU D00948]
MNTLLEVRDLETDTRISVSPAAPDLRLIDRVALRVGLALLLWGQRRIRTDPAEARRLQLVRRHAELERDRLVARSALYR